MTRKDLRQVLTKQAVHDAIQEYLDAPDPDEFIARAHSGRPRSYWISHAGQKLPMKAIAGRALQIANGNSPEFGGRSANATQFAPVLRELGFNIIHEVKK